MKHMCSIKNLNLRSVIRFLPGVILILLLISCSGNRSKKITIVETTDIHGVILPYDYIEKKDLGYSMASSLTYIKGLRENGKTVLLLDDGDNLQGQPEVYYYNFIDTVSNHFLAEVMNYMKYDAASVGNHDIEAGHSVYDRLVKEYMFPLLAANAVDKKNGKPYFKPYVIIEKEGLKIAVFGLITPAIPTWLPEELYSGMEFRDMVSTAKLWMPVILNEKPDLVVGLFHSGWDHKDIDIKGENDMYENGSAAVAYNVPGFDIIFNGHDHKQANEKFVNAVGDTLLILNGGSHSELLAQADVIISDRKVKGKRVKYLKGSILNVSEYKPDTAFINKFRKQDAVITEYVNREIATSDETISSRDSYFGSSAFIDMIHDIQLKITGADISFAAPLSFDVQISKGAVTVGDMFKLYRFENMLYTVNMTGEEIRKYLEYSYSGWLNTMKSQTDPLLKLRTGKDGKPVITNGKGWLKNQAYNFDSAAGIDYIVDVSKPEGNRIKISGFSDGGKFENNKMYKVAVNSYRGNGGGGHFTEGAGIGKEELRSRILTSTDRDLRYYILKSIEEQKVIKPVALNSWKIFPESWVKSARAREYKLLFGSK